MNNCVIQLLKPRNISLQDDENVISMLEVLLHEVNDVNHTTIANVHNKYMLSTVE